MTPWKWITADGWKPHAVPAYLAEALIADLGAREEAKGHEPLSFEAQDTHHMIIDMPGMVAVDRPWMSFQIDGLVVEIPCEDVGAFLHNLKQTEPRTWTKGESQWLTASYYKLHGWNRCVVLTPDLRAQLLELLEAGVADAETQATVFWAGRKLPSEVLREAAAHTTGKPIEEIPDLGGHKQDRFKTMMAKKGDA